MFVAALGSGSAGNSYLFESESTRILVDAGFGTRETKRRLARVGRSIESIRAIVLTHEHSDHIHGAEKIARKYGIPIYLTEGTLAALDLDRTEVPTVVFANDAAFQIGDLNIHARRTIHDATDPACFVVEAGDGTRVGLATDLGCVDPPVLRHLSGCDGLFFEANHDLDMLRAGTYPWNLKRRIMSRYGHLSNDDSISALQRMMGAELTTLCLIHMSTKNNHESIVRSMASQLIASTGAAIELEIAPQNRPTQVFEISRRNSRRASRADATQMKLF